MFLVRGFTPKGDTGPRSLLIANRPSRPQKKKQHALRAERRRRFRPLGVHRGTRIKTNRGSTSFNRSISQSIINQPTPQPINKPTNQINQVVTRLGRRMSYWGEPTGFSKWRSLRKTLAFWFPYGLYPAGSLTGIPCFFFGLAAMRFCLFWGYPSFKPKGSHHFFGGPLRKHTPGIQNN